MTDIPCIETIGLTKTYGDIRALDGLDLVVPSGSICGFVGRNGAGKTTAIKILLGMAHASAGSARLFGLPVDREEESVAIRARTGFVAEDKDLYRYMTVDALIAFTASFYPRWRRDLQQRYLKAFDLPPDRHVRALSHGTRTKLALLLALCRGADLLVLDEPTSGLDPATTEEVLQALIGHVAAEGMTVFFSSHQIADVDQIADRVAMIDRGRTVLSASLDDLRASYRRIQLVFDTDAPDATWRTSGVVNARRTGRLLTLLVSDANEALLAEARELRPLSVDVQPVTLKEIFLGAVTGER